MANYRALFYVVTSRYLLRLTTLPVFLICHIRMKIGFLRTFSSRCVTSGNRQWALVDNVMELIRRKHHHVQAHRRNTDPAHPPDGRTTQQKQIEKESLSLYLNNNSMADSNFIDYVKA